MYTRFKKDFEQIEPLGSGAFGEVLLVLHKSEKQKYAVKIVKLLKDEKGTSVIPKDIQFAVTDPHPHIVQCYDSWTEEVLMSLHAFIQMEYCPGGSLQEAFERQNIKSVEEGLRLLQGILEGLKYIHARDMIHRDITPGNILLTADQVPKISDMGMAADATLQSHTTGTGAGAGIYNAPEILGRHYTSKVDIYRYPLKLDEFFKYLNIFRFVGSYPAPFGKGMTSEDLTKIKAIIQRLLTVNPASRPSAQQLLSGKFYPMKLLQLKAERLREEGKYTESLRVWKQILDLNVELSNEERFGARKTAWSLYYLLPKEEYASLSSVEIVTHSELAISVLDGLIQTEKNEQSTYPLLLVRWNNDYQLIKKGKGLGSWKKLQEIYVRKVREVYARFSPAKPHRIDGIFIYIDKFDRNKMQIKELWELNHEVEAARGYLERMSEDEGKESGRWSYIIERDLEFQVKNTLLWRAKEEVGRGRFTEKLRLWKQIVEMKIELYRWERFELRDACQPLEKQMPAEPATTQEKCDHSDLAVSTIECYVRQASMRFTEEKLLFSLLWENEEVLVKCGKLNSTVNERALRVSQLIKVNVRREGISVDNAYRISVCAHFLGKMEDGREKLEELRKLLDEVEEWWKTHPTWKNAAKLAELSKVKAEVRRLDSLPEICL